MEPDDCCNSLGLCAFPGASEALTSAAMLATSQPDYNLQLRFFGAGRSAYTPDIRGIHADKRAF